MAVVGGDFSAAHDALRRQEELATHRKHCQELEGKGWQHLDDLVFKVAAGGLAISVTLLGVTNNVQAASMPWMYGAWGLWSLSLTAILLSIATGQHGLRSIISRIDDGTHDSVDRPEGLIGALTPALNHTATATCIAALVCLLVFAVFNVTGGKQMAQGADRTTAQKGTVAPQARPTTQPASSSSGQRGQVAPQITPARPTTAGTVAPQIAKPTTPPTKKG